MIERRIEIDNLKDMLNKTKQIFKEKKAYKIKTNSNEYKTYTHYEVRQMIDYLGTALIDLGLKNKRIAVIGENRFEWEIAYLSIVCGTGIVVPLDKALPEKELESLIERSKVDAIFYSAKFEDALKNIKHSNSNLKHLISMDLKQSEKEVLSFWELIEKGKALVSQGDRSYIDAKINSDEMSIMLFTSGTTSKSKVVALSHKNICSNLMDVGSVLDIDSNDVFLSVLPIHHVFECTVGFLFALYKGAQTVFCDGLRHIVQNLNEYNVTIMACVPAIYERIFGIIRKQLDKQGKLDDILKNEELYKNSTMVEKRKVFKEVHDLIGGHIKLFISGAAALDKNIEERYRLLGINLVQGYGLTETSPVVAVGTNENYRCGSIGKPLPSVRVMLADVNQDGIGELLVKGPNVALGYFEDEENTKKSFVDGWFHTGDLARIDEDGFVFICGRKKSVIVLKNGKNIFPEEMENIFNRIDGIKESFIYGMPITEDENNIKIRAKLVIDRDRISEVYGVKTDDEIYKVFANETKKINSMLPSYKAVRGISLTDVPLIKTTTNKIKRQENLDEINKSKNELFGYAQHLF